MCLINFAFKHNDQYPLILVGNRDEFYDRATEKLHWWHEDGLPILAGKDLKEGGTWMGINMNGDFALVTNYRDLKNIKSHAPSRGLLLKQYLSGEYNLETMSSKLISKGKNYNGFNIIYGNSEQLFYFSNVEGIVTELRPGIYGLSNAFLDTTWPKLVKSKTEFTQQLEKEINVEEFINILHNRNLAEDSELPETGAPYPLEKQLSAMFINIENYGTRLTTFVSIDAAGNVIYREKSYVPEHEITFKFKIEK